MIDYRYQVNLNFHKKYISAVGYSAKFKEVSIYIEKNIPDLLSEICKAECITRDKITLTFQQEG